MIAAIYARVSTTQHQDNKRQVDELLELARKNNYIVDHTRIYEDQISGTISGDKRPEFTRLMDDLKSKDNEIQVLLVHEVSRLSRDGDDGPRIVMELVDLGVGIHIMNPPICSLGQKADRFMFKTMFPILSSFAEIEAEFIRERVTSGLKNRAKLGFAPGGKLMAYGYKREDKRLVIDEDEAIVIQKIFDLSMRGYGTKVIANTLNRLAIPTKNQIVSPDKTIKFKTGNKETRNILWTDSVVYSILINSIYVGKRRYMNEIIDTPVIVSADTFNSVQDNLRKKATTKEKSSKYDYLVSKLLKCGYCGRNMVGRYRPSLKDAAYQCSDKRIVEHNCKNRAISIEAIESVVWDYTRLFKLSRHDIEEYNYSLDSLKKKLKQIEDVKKKIQRVIQEPLAERQRIIGLLIRGVVEENLVQKELDSCNSKIKMYEEETKKYQEEETEILTKIESLIKTSNESVHFSNMLSREEIKNLLPKYFSRISTIHINKKGNISSYLVALELNTLRRQYKGKFNIPYKLNYHDNDPNFSFLLIYTGYKNNNRNNFVDSEAFRLAGQDFVKYIQLDGNLMSDELFYMFRPNTDMIFKSDLQGFAKLFYENGQSIGDPTRPIRMNKVDDKDIIFNRNRDTHLQFTDIDYGYVEIVPTLLSFPKKMIKKRANSK